MENSFKRLSSDQEAKEDSRKAKTLRQLRPTCYKRYSKVREGQSENGCASQSPHLSVFIVNDLDVAPAAAVSDGLPGTSMTESEYLPTSLTEIALLAFVATPAESVSTFEASTPLRIGDGM
jgi:hypothetical protein